MDLTVYSAPWCPDCREAKRWLAKHNINLTEIDIESELCRGRTVVDV